MAWLGTYAKRRKVTVSNTNIDSDLTHFPLLLTLGTSVGTGNDEVAHFKMNDNLATTAVINDVGTNGVLGGGDNTDDLSVAGKINTALNFNGSDDHVDIADDDIYSPTDMSISLWMKADTLASDGLYMAFSKFGITDYRDWYIAAYDDDSDGDCQIRCYVENTNDDGATVQGTTTLSTGTWYNIIATYDGSTGVLNAYLNNSSEGTDTSSAYGVHNSTAGVMIGARYPASPERFFDGAIDDIRVYDKILTVNERAEIYNSGSGTEGDVGGTDVSSIFDELTSDANRLKIALTKTDGTTQLYGEIEKWDDANEAATIWVSKSDLVLATGGTTDIYIYYDAAQADNTTYIGDTNDAVAENVWDSNYKMVQHMADGASTSATYDSTDNDLDGTKKDANEPAVTTSGKISNAQDFDGSDDYMTTGTTGFSITTGTFDTWVIPGFDYDTATAYSIFFSLYTGGDDRWNAEYWAADDKWHFYLRSAVDQITNLDSAAQTFSAGTPIKITLSWDASDAYLYINGVQADTGTTRTITLPAALNLGRYGGTGLNFDGILDEVRQSATRRSVDWIKADYYVQTDATAAWGAEEEYEAPEATGNAIMFAMNF